MIRESVVIETSRLRLRRARPDDLAAFHAIFRDPVATQFWSTPPHSTLGETAEWLTKVIEAPAETSNEFVVEFEGVVVGKAGCWRVPEVGFIFDPRCWGKGVAFEALPAVIRSTFEAFPTPEVTADVDPRNLRCLRLLERLGFLQTGSAHCTWPVGNDWTDSVYLSPKGRPEK